MMWKYNKRQRVWMRIRSQFGKKHFLFYFTENFEHCWALGQKSWFVNMGCTIRTRLIDWLIDWSGTTYSPFLIIHDSFTQTFGLTNKLHQITINSSNHLLTHTNIFLSPLRTNTSFFSHFFLFLVVVYHYFINAHNPLILIINNTSNAVFSGL